MSPPPPHPTFFKITNQISHHNEGLVSFSLDGCHCMLNTGKGGLPNHLPIAHSCPAAFNQDHKQKHPNYKFSPAQKGPNYKTLNGSECNRKLERGYLGPSSNKIVPLSTFSGASLLHLAFLCALYGLFFFFKLALTDFLLLIPVNTCFCQYWLC